MNRIALSFVAALTLLTSIASASPVGGQATASGALAAGERKIFNVVLRADEDWRLIARGYGEDGDLDCFIVDEDGNVIGRDADSTNTCLIQGHPRWTGVFHLVVVNNGDESIGFNAQID
jgi:hypothetical protein